MPRHGQYEHVVDYWRKMPIAVLNQDPPVLNVWYEVLPETEDPRLIYISTRRLDDDVNAKNVQIRIEVDGITHGYGQTALNNNTWYHSHTREYSDNVTQIVNIVNPFYYEDLRGRSVRVLIRQVDAPGVNAELDGRVQYEVWRPT